MRLVRFRTAEGEVRQGIEDNGATYFADGQFPHFTKADQKAEVNQLLAPIQPTQIICIGLNYRTHAAESNSPIPDFPVVFYKNLGAVQGPGGPIQLPRFLRTGKPDYEGELAVVIGRDCKDATEESALGYVAGYMCGNDVSARDWQREWGGSQWGRAKGFDTFCPLGPAMVTPDEIPDPNALRIKTTLNDQVVQDWNTDDMIFSVRNLIAFLSADTTIPAGSVIMTGTPSGVGMGRTPQLWLKDGDTVTVEIEKIGKLTNYVVGT